MAARYRITAPVEGVNSTVAGVCLDNSVGETDSPGALAYFRRQGYRVEEIVEVAPEPAVVLVSEPGPELPPGPPGPSELPSDPSVADIKKPGKSASKADWVAYALAQGVTAEESDALTRDALAERFADPSGDEA